MPQTRPAVSPNAPAASLLASNPGAPRAAAPRRAAAKLLAKAAKLERAGDLGAAVAEYEAALAAAPDEPEIIARLAALAARMALPAAAAPLWARVIELEPDRLQAIDGHARALRDLGLYNRAIDLLRAALLTHPKEPGLWNSLGVTLTQDSRAETALTFFDEALRLDRRNAAAAYNRGNAWFDLGNLAAAEADFSLALKLSRDPTEIARIDFAAATVALARGEVGAGWDAYEARLSRHWPGAVFFAAPGRRWAPTWPLARRRLLVMAEQGLGDEIMLANVLPDVADALGPEGRLSVAVEPRLVDLFRRSFPSARVVAHATERIGNRLRRSAPDLREPRDIDFWAPMGSLPRAFRRTLESFPKHGGYLRPDPTRVAHWRAWLGSGPPAVGISWRSGKVAGDRRRFYPPLDLWAPLVTTPGVRFVNLQYGECADDLAALEALAGRPILKAPGLDLREHIDDLAALCAALDLTVSVSNATGALAGACGAPLALIGPPASWPRLGAENHPWFPQAHALTAPAFGQWAPPMAEAAALVAALV